MYNRLYSSHLHTQKNESKKADSNHESAFLKE